MQNPNPSQSAPKQIPTDPGMGWEALVDAVETRASPRGRGLGPLGNCHETPVPPEGVLRVGGHRWGSHLRDPPQGSPAFTGP